MRLEAAGQDHIIWLYSREENQRQEGEVAPVQLGLLCHLAGLAQISLLQHWAPGGSKHQSLDPGGHPESQPLSGAQGKGLASRGLFFSSQCGGVGL